MSVTVTTDNPIWNSKVSSENAASQNVAGVLLVDDTPFICSLLKGLLVSHSFQVWTAESGTEALEIFRAHSSKISVALLDVQMPGLDGPETAEELLKINPDLPYCFMSGDPGKYTATGLQARGARAFFDKPLSLNRLIDTLKDLTR